MESLKQFLIAHFEKIIVLVILGAAIFGTFFLQEKTFIFNFYYLPAVFAGYFLGRRLGVLTALLSILIVVACIILFPGNFFAGRDLLQTIANLSAWGGFLILTSIAVGSLYEEKERRMDDLKKAYIGILEILSKYLESADRYTKGHSVRVADYAMNTAIALELPRPTVEVIRAAALLHDIGKIEISSEVLTKAAELSQDERELMNAHAEKGGLLLARVGEVLKDVIPIVEAHHKFFQENVDKSNIQKIKIPLGARIIAVADSFDAMTSDRPYRKGMLPWEAMRELLANSGKQFDPAVVEAFKRVVGDKLETI